MKLGSVNKLVEWLLPKSLNLARGTLFFPFKSVLKHLSPNVVLRMKWDKHFHYLTQYLAYNRGLISRSDCHFLSSPKVTACVSLNPHHHNNAQCFTHHRNPGNPRDYHRGQFPTLDKYFTTITFLGGSPNFTGCILYRFITSLGVFYIGLYISVLLLFYYSVNNLSTASNGS